MFPHNFRFLKLFFEVVFKVLPWDFHEQLCLLRTRSLSLYIDTYICMQAGVHKNVRKQINTCYRLLQTVTEGVKAILIAKNVQDREEDQEK